MEVQTQLQIYRAVEYIRQDPEFPFDTHDDPEEILNYYGIDLELSTEEKNLLVGEISRIAEEAQTIEIMKLVTSDLPDQADHPFKDGGVPIKNSCFSRRYVLAFGY